MAAKLTHLDADGHARMVDVGDKAETVREALAVALIKMKPKTLALVLRGTAPKGDVLAVARVAGIQAAKRTSELIPLCHLLALSSCELMFEPRAKKGELLVRARVRCTGPTGVEMEALTAVSVAALTIYDMLKAVERGIEIQSIRLLEKSGGASGFYKATR